MKRTKNKGFTLVELVIVIAVIAILAGVLIGTFATVLTNANKSKAMQEAKTMFTEYLTEIDYVHHSELAEGYYIIKNGDYYFAVNKGTFDTNAYTLTDALTNATPSEKTLTDNELHDDNPTTAGNYFVKIENADNMWIFTVIN